jgi:predicted PolB exonuclease-like 3'-5' exonuclease
MREFLTIGRIDPDKRLVVERVKDFKEIYELFDGHINSDFCLNHKEICPFRDCTISEIIDDLTKTFIEKFKEKKIGDLDFKF